MDKTLQQKLFDKYPKLFANLIERKDGIWCRDGWYQILEDVCGFIQRVIDNEWNQDRYTQIQFLQIKEKFGTLRVYYEGGNDETRQLVNSILSFADYLSERSCEVCGTRENMGYTSKGWIQCICKTCFDNREQKSLRDEIWTSYDTNSIPTADAENSGGAGQ